MKSYISKLNTLIWFIKRKNHWPYAFELIKRTLFYYFIKNKNINSIEWCEKKSVDINEALIKLKINEPGVLLKDIDNKIIQEGNKKILEAGITLGGGADLKLLFNIVLLLKPKKVLETGVAFGWSSMSILLAQQKIVDSILISIDMPYPKQNNEKYVGLVVPEQLKNKWKLVREPDRNGIKKALFILNGEIDLCHYDSDKSYEGRKYAYPIIWDAIRVGGIFISDDIEDNFYFSEFVDENKLNYAIIKCNEKYVGIIKK